MKHIRLFLSILFFLFSHNITFAKYYPDLPDQNPRFIPSPKSPNETLYMGTVFNLLNQDTYRQNNSLTNPNIYPDSPLKQILNNIKLPSFLSYIDFSGLFGLALDKFLTFLFPPPKDHTRNSHNNNINNNNDNYFTGQNYFIDKQSLADAKRIEAEDFSRSTITDVKEYARGTSNLEMLKNHSKWSYPAYFQYLQTLDEYRDYIFELDNKFKSHKERKQYRYIEGFQKRGFVEKIQNEAKRIIDEQKIAVEKINNDCCKFEKSNADKDLISLYRNISTPIISAKGRELKTLKLGQSLVETLIDPQNQEIILHIEEYKNDAKLISDLYYRKNEIGNVELSVQSRELFSKDLPKFNIHQNDFIDRKIVTTTNNLAKFGYKINPINNFEVSIFKDLSTTAITGRNSLIKQAVQFNSNDKIEESYHLLTFVSNLVKLAKSTVKAGTGFCAGNAHSLIKNAELVLNISKTLFKGCCYVTLHPIETADTIAIATCLYKYPNFYNTLPSDSYEKEIADRILTAKQKIVDVCHVVWEDLNKTYNKIDKYAAAFAPYEMYEHEPLEVIDKINSEKIKATKQLINRIAEDPYEAGYFTGNFVGDWWSSPKLIHRSLSKCYKSLKKLAFAANEIEAGALCAQAVSEAPKVELPKTPSSPVPVEPTSNLTPATVASEPPIIPSTSQPVPEIITPNQPNLVPSSIIPELPAVEASASGIIASNTAPSTSLITPPNIITNKFPTIVSPEVITKLPQVVLDMLHKFEDAYLEALCSKFIHLEELKHVIWGEIQLIETAQLRKGLIGGMHTEVGFQNFIQKCGFNITKCETEVLSNGVKRIVIPRDFFANKDSFDKAYTKLADGVKIKGAKTLWPDHYTPERILEATNEILSNPINHVNTNTYRGFTNDGIRATVHINEIMTTSYPCWNQHK